MARILVKNNPLAWEAKSLNIIGYTHQQIANILNKPRQDISYWLKILGNGKPSNVSQVIDPPTNIYETLPNININLYSTTYEKAAVSIQPETIDLIVTDPPYLVADNNITRNGRTPLIREFGDWDKTPQAEYEVNVKLWAQLMASHLKTGGSLYLFMSLSQYTIWSESLKIAGLEPVGELIWHRTNPAPQIRKTRWCHAFNAILFYTKGSPKIFKWLGQNEMHNVITGPICMGDERQYHPTQKPRWILEKLIFVSSKVGDIIMDPFAGSGSTAFAAVRLGRSTIVIEPEPKYSGLIESTAKDEFPQVNFIRMNG